MRNSYNRTSGIRHQCRKATVLSGRRCLCVEKNEQNLNIGKNFDHQISLSKSKCWYSNNRTAHNRHQCRKTIVSSCHRCLISTGVKKMNNIKI